MTQKAKQAQPSPRPTTQVVLFGLDESGKPKAARFPGHKTGESGRLAEQNRPFSHLRG